MYTSETTLIYCKNVIQFLRLVFLDYRQHVCFRCRVVIPFFPPSSAFPWWWSYRDVAQLVEQWIVGALFYKVWYNSYMSFDYKEYQKKYQPLYQKARYHRKKNEFIQYLGGKCIQCGATEHLQFDHKNPSDKCFSIMSKWKLPLDEIKTELDKCQLLCAKCHLKKTSADLNWEKGIGETRSEKQKLYRKRWYERHKEEYNARRRDRRKTQNVLQKRSTGGGT